MAKKLHLSYLERENILMFSLGPYSHLADGDGNPRRVKAAAQTLFALTVNNFVKNISLPVDGQNVNRGPPVGKNNNVRGGKYIIYIYWCSEPPGKRISHKFEISIFMRMTCEIAHALKT